MHPEPGWQQDTASLDNWPSKSTYTRRRGKGTGERKQASQHTTPRNLSGGHPETPQLNPMCGSTPSRSAPATAPNLHGTLDKSRGSFAKVKTYSRSERVACICKCAGLASPRLPAWRTSFSPAVSHNIATPSALLGHEPRDSRQPTGRLAEAPRRGLGLKPAGAAELSLNKCAWSKLMP